MQHPRDVKGSDKPKSLLSIPVGQRYTTILGRLNRIESEIKVIHHVVGKEILTLNQIEERIAIMQEKIDGMIHGADVRNHRYYKLEEDYNRQLSKCAVTQATIKTIQEKLNGID